MIAFFFFFRPLLHRGASAPHMFLRSEERNGHQPRRRIVVSHCKALPRVYRLHHPTDCHEPSGSTENLLCDPKLKCFRLSLTTKGLKSSFILSSCAGIEKPRHPVFLKEQKDTEKYFHAGLIPWNEKKFSRKEQGPDIDFISRICSYGCILAIDGCQDKKESPFSHCYVTIYRLPIYRRIYKILVSVATELMAEALTYLAQIRSLTVNLHSSQLEMCWSKSNSNFSNLKDTQQCSK